MKVRDIKQYRQRIIAKTNDDIENFNLGAEDEPILVKLYAEDAAIKDIIEDISSFADNTFEQIFYEFLQNADDASASQMTIHFDENKLVVINNGEPFLTDGTRTKGQLRSFLRSKDSKKRNEEGVIGKYGLGSKLLYDLIPNVNNTEGRTQDQLRKKALIKDLKGVYLYSWSNLSQIETITQGIQSGDIIFEASPEDNNQPLLAKILYSYYPAYINQEKGDFDGNIKNLFSEQEFNDFRKGIENTFTFENKFNFDKGTAIYIPIGKGVSLELQKKLETVLEKRIGVALNFLRNVKQVKINSKTISKVKGEKINIIFSATTFDDDDNEVEKNFQSALFLPNEIDISNTNFYQYLPIIEEKRKLGFIVHTENLKLLQNRQNIKKDEEHNKNMFKKIFEQLDKKLESHFDNNDTLYKKFINNFVQSQEPDLLITKEYFYDNIIERLKQSLPIANSEYENAENIKIKSTKLNINPSDIGLGFHWLNESFEDNYKDFKIKFGLPTWAINNLLEKAETENVSSWVKNLSEADYKLLLSELNGTPSFPFIKTSNKQVLTRAELKNNENIIPLTSKTKDLKDIFYAQGIEYTNIDLTEKALLPSFTDDELIKRITSLLVKENLNENQKYTIFKTFKTHFAGKEKELDIFKNRKGDFYKLGKLVKNDTDFAPSGILYDFQIAPIEPYLNEYDGYFLKEDEVWNVIRGNWGRINLTKANFLKAIDDFNTLYLKAGNSNKLDKNFDWISTINGFSSKENVFYQEAWTETITENDYKVLVEIIRRITDFKFLSFENLKKLSAVSFAELPRNGFTEIKNKIKAGINDFEFSLDEIEVLNDIKSNSTFFNYFIITEELDNQNYKAKIKENNDIQFFTTDQDAKEFLAKQTSYYCLPKSLSILFDDTRLDFEKEVNVYQWVNKFGAKKELFRLVTKPENNNQYNTKSLYLGKLENIELFNEVETYENSFEENVIKLILERQEWVDAYRDKVLIDNKKSTEYIYQEKVSIVNIPYFSLSELLPEYAESSRKLQSIKDKLVGISKSNLDKFFTTKEYNHSEIERKLKEIGINNPEQLSFIIALRKDNPTKTINDFDITHLSDEYILTSFYEHNLTSFSQFSNGKNWFAIHNYIDTQSNLFSEEEKLPDFIENWRVTDIKKTQFLKEAGLKIEESHIFKFRTALNENKGAKENISEIIESKHWSNKTQDWLKGRFTNFFERNKDEYKTIQAFFDAYSEKYDIDNIFRLVVEKDEIRVKIGSFSNQGFKVTKIDKELIEVWYDVIKDNNNYTFYDVYDAKNISDKIGKEAKIEGEFIENENISEWENDNKYVKWRDKIMKNKYQIFFSSTQLPFKYTLHLGVETEVIEKDYKNGLRAKVKKDGIEKLYIYEESGKNKRKLLIEYREDLFGNNNDDLTKLLELDYEDETLDAPKSDENNIFITPTDNQKLAHIQQYSDEDIIKMVQRYNANPTGKDGDLKAEDWNDDEKAKFEKYKEQLRQLLNLENIDEILSDLEKLKKILKALKDEPKINPISGYIGERLIYEWMKLKGCEVWHVNKAEYDIKLIFKKQDYHIEVKTTSGTTTDKDASSKIFLRERQESAIENEKYNNYFLVQIGLMDLGLYSFYKQFREYNLDEVKDIIDKEVRKIMNEELAQKIKQNRIRYRLTLPEGLDDPFS